MTSAVFGHGFFVPLNMGDFLGVTTANVKNNAGAFAKFLNIFWICATKANIGQSFLSTLVVRWSFEEMNAAGEPDAQNCQCLSPPRNPLAEVFGMTSELFSRNNSL
jgi:hypothetical protein